MQTTGRKKPLILRAVSRMAVGGVQRGILATLARADRERFDYAVLCTKKEGSWAGRLRELDCPLYLQKTLPPWNPYQIWRLSRLIRRIGPDLVHVHMAPMVIPVVTAARLAGVRHYVIQHHNFYDRHWDAQNPLLYRWERQLTRGAGAVLAVSESVGELTARRLGLSDGKVVIAYNGIEVSSFQQVAPHDPRPEWGLAPDTPLVVQVSRYLDTKRIEDFIEAGALVGRHWNGSDPRPVFVVIGGGAEDYRRAYERKIDALGARDLVRLAGTRDDVAALLQTVQVGALSSEMEGFGQVVLEYTSAGLPVAATNLPPITELLRPGQEVLLSPPRQPALLAANIERLLKEPELAASLVEQARRRLALFDWSASVRTYEAVYTRLLGL